MIRPISKRYKEIMSKNDKNLEKLHFFIKFCLLASHENGKSFKENAIHFKDKYSILYEGFRMDSIVYTLENFDVKVVSKKLPGLTVKNDRIFDCVLFKNNNSSDGLKEILFNDETFSEIEDILQKTRTNIWNIKDVIFIVDIQGVNWNDKN